jgi:hypothetical protein
MTTIEKVARAIAQDQGTNNWRRYLSTARAAVTALSVPSVDMLYAALPDCPDWGYLPEDWSAMVAYVAQELIGAEAS